MWTNGTRIGAAFVIAALSAGPVLAAGEAGGHGEAEVSLFAGDLGNAIWTLLIFVLVLVVLGKFVWGPVLKGLQKREAFIRDSLTHARQQNEDAKRTLAEYVEKLERARQEATAIVDEGRRDAEAVKKKVMGEAKAEADAAVKRAKKEIELARDDAVKQLHDQTVMLATNIASKIVRRQLSPGDQKQLLDEALSEMGKLN